jgi:glycosyltransferase involved in cell wall biosynthesis
MHIHWVANFVVPPPVSFSGGDRIMVECLRRWAREHRVTLYGSEATKQLADYMKLEGVTNVTWPTGRWAKWPRPVMWTAQTFIGKRHARAVSLPKDEPNLLVAASDFMPNLLPTLELKRRHPHVPLVACFFLFAPPLRDWLMGKPGPGFMYSAYRPAQMVMLKKILRHADMILTTGEEDREILIQKYGRAPGQVFAVRGGVDLSIPRSVPEPAEKLYDAVFIGRLHWMKGVRELVEIWRTVNDARPGAKLAMIGSGPLDAELKARTATLGLKDCIRFCGFADGVEKYQVVKAARVVVHPAVYEVGGMAAAEALACGLPGVTFDHPALRDYYPKGFLKAAPNDFDGFAKNIVTLLSEPELYARTSKDAHAAGQTWDWDTRAAAILEAILKQVKPA